MSFRSVLLLSALCLSLMPTAQAIDIDIEDSGLDQPFDTDYFYETAEIDDFEANAYKEASPAKSVGRAAAAGCQSFEGSLRGQASFYGPGFEGRRTSCGNIFRSSEMTAALKIGNLTASGRGRSFECGARALVTNTRNGRQVWVTLTDVGGLTPSRVIDLSRGAAQRLGFIQQGVTDVTVQICPAS